MKAKRIFTSRPKSWLLEIVQTERKWKEQNRNMDIYNQLSFSSVLYKSSLRIKKKNSKSTDSQKTHRHLLFGLNEASTVLRLSKIPHSQNLMFYNKPNSPTPRINFYLKEGLKDW